MPDQKEKGKDKDRKKKQKKEKKKHKSKKDKKTKDAVDHNFQNPFHQYNPLTTAPSQYSHVSLSPSPIWLSFSHAPAQFHSGKQCVENGWIAR